LLSFISALLGLKSEVKLLLVGLKKDVEVLLVDLKKEVKFITESTEYFECPTFESALNLAMAYALAWDKEIKTIDIFARTGIKYYEAIVSRVDNPFLRNEFSDSWINELGLDSVIGVSLEKIGTLRLLAAENSMLHASNMDCVETRWNDIVSNNGDKLLEKPALIESCPLFSANHYAIINNKYVVEGSYKHIRFDKNSTNYEERLLETFVFLHRHYRDKNILKSYKNHFKNNFEETKNATKSSDAKKLVEKQ